MADSTLVSTQTDKIYRQSGFSSTIRNSADISGSVAVGRGMAHSKDLNPLVADDSSEKLYKFQGFTSTVTDSEGGPFVGAGLAAVNDDSANSYAGGYAANKIWKISGQFTSTVKASFDFSANWDVVQGIAFDGTDLMAHHDNPAPKLVLYSGSITSTIKDSQDTSSFTSPKGVSWDGTNTHIVDDAKSKKLQGRFTTTVIESYSHPATAIGDLGQTDSSLRLGLVSISGGLAGLRGLQGADALF